LNLVAAPCDATTSQRPAAGSGLSIIPAIKRKKSDWRVTLPLQDAAGTAQRYSGLPFAVQQSCLILLSS